MPSCGNTYLTYDNSRPRHPHVLMTTSSMGAPSDYFSTALSLLSPREQQEVVVTSEPPASHSQTGRAQRGFFCWPISSRPIPPSPPPLPSQRAHGRRRAVLCRSRRRGAAAAWDRTEAGRRRVALELADREKRETSISLAGPAPRVFSSSPIVWIHRGPCLPGAAGSAVGCWLASMHVLLVFATTLHRAAPVPSSSLLLLLITPTWLARGFLLLRSRAVDLEYSLASAQLHPLSHITAQSRFLLRAFLPLATS